MNILYCGDRGIEQGLKMSVLSLVQNCTEALHIFVMTMDFEWKGRRYEAISDNCVQKLSHLLSQHSGSIRKIECSELFKSELPMANMDTRFTPGCMLRLYADLLPQIPDRILYLDYDVLCMNDPSEFYNQNIDNQEFVAVKDYYGRWFYTPFTNKYFNSGVMLLNMSYIRRSGLLRKSRVLCATRQMFLPDQHALNRTYSVRKLADRRYNDQRRTHADTVFRHFSTTWRVFPWPHTVSVKPWDEDRMHKLLKEHKFDKLMEDLKNFNETKI